MHIFTVIAFLLIALCYAQEQPRILIGDLSMRQHDVSGTVYALDSRTLLIEDLTYDGLGPAGVFWIDVVDRATSQGRLVAFKDTCEADNRLPAYNGNTVTLELPPDLTLDDVRYFSVWCRAVSVEFGGVSIPENFVADNNVPILPVASCASEEEQQMAGLFPVQQNWNCDKLSDQLQLRWNVNNDMIDIELIARINEGQYIGFGPSGQGRISD